jgi:hypothetical protein
VVRANRLIMSTAPQIETDKPYREIHLPSGHVVLVDEEDYERVVKLRWRVQTKASQLVAVRFWDGRKYTPLHRFVLGDSVGVIGLRYSRIIHTNRNVLDCRKSNLSISTKTYLTCAQCKRVFPGEPGRAREHANVFCGKLCANRFRRTGELVLCMGCGRSFYRQKCLLSRGDNRFHSHECYQQRMRTIGYAAERAALARQQRRPSSYMGSLERFIEWTGSTCAYLRCKQPIANKGKYAEIFHLCSYHSEVLGIMLSRLNQKLERGIHV